MDITAVATWVQGQGPFVKGATILLIALLAGIAIAFILKTPDNAQKHSNPASAPAVPPPESDTLSSTPIVRKKHASAHHSSSPSYYDRHDTPTIEVKSEGQSGGITAGQIGNVNINNGTQD